MEKLVAARPLGEVIDAIRTLRALGAVAVTVGDVGATFAGPVPAALPAEPARKKTAAEEQAEYEATLFASAE